MPSYNLTPPLGYETKKDAQNKANKDLSNVPQSVFAAKMAEGGMEEIAGDIAEVKTDTTAIKADTTNIKSAASTVNSKISNATYGLEAIEQKVSEATSKLNHSTYGLSAIKSAVNTVKSVNSRYTPIPTLQKTLLNTEVSHDGRWPKLIAKFMPEKDGVMILRARIKNGTSDITKRGYVEMGTVNTAVIEDTNPNGCAISYPTAQDGNKTGQGNDIVYIYRKQNYINYSTTIGTIVSESLSIDDSIRGTISLFSSYGASYKTGNVNIQVVKGIPIMIYLKSMQGNTIYCDLVQLLYEEV